MAIQSVVVDGFGVTVEVRVGGDRAGEVLDRLGELWEFCPVLDRERPEVVVEVLLESRFDTDPAAWRQADAAGVVARPDLRDLLQVLTQRVTESAVDARAGRCLMLHAACLADPASGAAVTFVAPGGTGKTTLVRTLGPGRWYVTDETTVVLDDHTVVPYPKPLSIRRAAGSPLKDETAPSDLGLQAPRGRTHLAALCLLERDDHHDGRPLVENLSTLDAVVALVPQTSHLVDLPRPLRHLAELAESLGGVRRIRYRECAELAELWDDLLGGVA